MAKELAVLPNDDALRSIASFDDALKALEAAGVSVVDTKEFGTGFTLVKEKDQFVGKDFLIMGVRFVDNDKGEHFAAVHIVTAEGNKAIITDGGTGIYDQLKAWSNGGEKIQGYIVRGGLRRSDFTYTDEKTGEQKPATTFYLNN